jgi:hypothetical protein
MDLFLGRALAVAALMAGAGVLYNYVVHVPSIERARRAAEMESVARTDRQQAQRAAAYQACVSSAHQNYSVVWAQACRRIAEIKATELNRCLRDPSVLNNPYMGPNYCHRTWGGADAGADCALPAKRADEIEATLENSKNRCEKSAEIEAFGVSRRAEP